MANWLVALVAVLGACKGGGHAKDGHPAPSNTTSSNTAALAAPSVDVPTVLAPTDGAPPLLLLVEPSGEVRLAAASSWPDLDASKLKRARKPGPFELLAGFVHEEQVFGRAPNDSIEVWDELASSDVAIDLALLSDDDPPPPADEDPPPPEDDEGGATGPALALEEGKLGAKRVEGQYKMRKQPDDPQLARQQAIEQVRAAGILGGGLSQARGWVSPHARLHPNADGTPARAAQVTGAVVTDGKLDRVRAMIVIPPALAASKLVEIVRKARGAIGVTHGGKLRPLRLDFASSRDDTPVADWVEVRMSANGIVVEAVPDKPIAITSAKQLASAIDDARKARGMAKDAPVDVLVDGAVKTQGLVDVLVALDVAGARMIGLGMTPSADELARRGKRTR